MIIELNIGLNVNGEVNSQLQCEQRAKQALQFLKQKFSSVKSATYTNQYETNDGTLVLEPGLFVRVSTVGSIFEIDKVIYDLAVELRQDCIAVYLPRSGVGKLIGPNADKWGKFDLTYFEQFADEFLV